MSKNVHRRAARTTRVLVFVLTAAVLGLLAGCGAGLPPGGDPGNRHLDQLRADPIFRTLPPDAQRTGPIVRTPARYIPPGFSGGGWSGPGVTSSFTSPEPPTTVFAYYATLAPSLGWIATGNRNILNYPEVWKKHFPGHKADTLSLIDLDIRNATVGATHTYVLNGSA